MRFERLLSQEKSGCTSQAVTSIFGQAAAISIPLSLLATLALWTLAWAPPGIQQLLLLCIVRLAVLVCIGTASYRALSRRRGEFASPVSGGPGLFTQEVSPRSSLTQAVLCLQLVWLASELLLGSALLAFHPYLLGAPVATTGAVLSVLPLACAAVMSGCFLFFQRLAARRRRNAARSGGSSGASPRSSGLECGLGAGSLAAHQQQQRYASSAPLPLHAHALSQPVAGAPCSCGAAPGGSHAGSTCGLHLAAMSSSSLDGVASPGSDAGSFSSCSSVGSASYYPATYGSSSLSSASSALLGGTSGAPSPTGHVRASSQAAAAHHEAALQAACEILLVEHECLAGDSSEWHLFVHKRLRPIRTRPEDKSKPAAPVEKPGLLRELITNSFTFQHDPELRAQLAASMAQHATSAPGGSAGSGASSITFQQAAAAAVGMGVM